MNTGPSAWDLFPDLVDQLKVEWANGKSAGQIARILGHGLTRNAVIGKKTRLGLPCRLPVIGTAARREARRKPGLVGIDLLPHGMSPSRKRGELAEPSMPEPIEGAPEPMVDEVGEPITMANVTKFHCRFVHGDPCTKDFRYCGRKVVRGHFCDFHAVRCYKEKHPYRRNTGVKHA